MKESAAEGSVAGSDCGLPDNFIHFTGRSKPSELHESDGELNLKLATLMEVSLVHMYLTIAPCDLQSKLPRPKHLLGFF